MYYIMIHIYVHDLTTESFPWEPLTTQPSGGVPVATGRRSARLSTINKTCSEERGKKSIMPVNLAHDIKYT